MPPTLFNWRVPSGQMASDWGSATLVIGARGHVNGESGLGDWPEGWAMLSALRARAG